MAPAELEDCLQEHPLIRNAAVVGVPCPASGERPRAYVVRADPSLTEREVRVRCLSRDLL